MLAGVEDRKLLRLSQMRELEGTEGGGLCKQLTLSKLRMPGEMEERDRRRMGYSDTDINGHVNNTRYADIVCDAVPWEVWDTAQIRDFTISYHREVPRGECFTLRRARPAEDTFYFDGEREGKSAFEAQLIFKHL